MGKERVQKLMQLHGIRARGKRRFKVTTDSRHDLPISPNVLSREFTVSEPDKVWVGDITSITTDEGWLFLAVVIEPFSRCDATELLRPCRSPPAPLHTTRPIRRSQVKAGNTDRRNSRECVRLSVRSRAPSSPPP